MPKRGKPLHIAGLTWGEWFIMLGLFAGTIVCSAALAGILILHNL